MPLVPVRDLLKLADENGFAVAAVDIFNFESAKWVVEAAERENLPAILMFYPDMKSFIPMDIIAEICRSLAEKSSVPVGTHLDHSRGFEAVLSGIPAGFQSIMFDGSSLPFEENAAISKKVADSARVFGVDVEAELGVVGSGSRRADFMDPGKYTTVEMAVAFVAETGVDSLAVSIGNSHGNYVCEPHLDVKRLDEINRAIPTPLVLHGGSGIPAEQMRESVRHGINKVNIGTEFFAKCKESCGKYLPGEGSVLKCMGEAGEEVIDLMRDRMRRLNPGGYSLPR
jgi:ketose-bisphosphate aldolase